MPKFGWCFLRSHYAVRVLSNFQRKENASADGLINFRLKFIGAAESLGQSIGLQSSALIRKQQ